MTFATPVNSGKVRTSNSVAPGPIADLRHASRCPAALILGALLGAFVPATTYVVVHVGGLLSVGNGRVTAAPLEHPGWALVAGGLAFSATTVFRWGCSAFRPSAGLLTLLESLYTHCKALGFVLLVEGTLLLSPSPLLGYVALGYLIVINALGTGSALALRDRCDLSRDREAVAPPVQSAAQGLRAKPPALPGSISGAESTAAVLTTVSDVAVGEEDVPDELYTRALSVASQVSSLSTDALRRGLRCRQPTAAAIISRLERDGVIGPVDPSDRGRRPVLMASRA
jgi:hypothetical protein